MLARVVRRTGQAGRRVGAAMAVTADGRWAGSVAGGCVDGDILVEAAAVLEGAPASLQRCEIGPDFRLPWEPGPACTGTITVLVAPLFDDEVCSALDDVLCLAATEPARPATLISTSLSPPYRTALGPAPTGADHVAEEVRPGPRLVLVGATDVALELALIAGSAGYRVVVLEPRPAYAAPGRVPGAALVPTWPSSWLAAHPLGSDDALVALTHEPRLDDAALVQALRDGCGYVAAIGSRETHRQRLARLAHIPGAAAIRGPAGLDLGGETAALTAVSVLAELVAVRNGRAGGPLHSGSGPVRAP